VLLVRPFAALVWPGSSLSFGSITLSLRHCRRWLRPDILPWLPALVSGFPPSKTSQESGVTPRESPALHHPRNSSGKSRKRAIGAGRSELAMTMFGIGSVGKSWSMAKPPVLASLRRSARVTPRKFSVDCDRGSDRPTTVGEWMRPTSGSKASGATFIGRWTRTRLQSCGSKPRVL
jgi:hypothetical protein